jgi:YihY family inner membrane protein
MPIFWWGLLLILLFSVQLGWTPVSGRIAVLYDVPPVTGFLLIDSLLSDDKKAFKSALSHLILPMIVLGTNPLAIIARMTRSAMLEVLGEDYIRTARAKGLSNVRVIALHAFRNALIPVVTVIGLQVGVLFTGAILTETIFSWPGVGKWLIEGINRRDYPVLQGGTLLIGASNVFQQLDLSFNKIWKVPKPQQSAGLIVSVLQTVRTKLFSFGMVLAVGFLLLVSMALTGATQVLSDSFQSVPLIGGVAGSLIGLATTLLLNTLVFALLFKYLPNTVVRWGDVWLGALVTAALWEIGKNLLALYIGRSGQGWSAYGLVGAVLILMAWIYFSSQILFLGAEFTEVYSRRHGSRVPQVTAQPVPDPLPEAMRAIPPSPPPAQPDRRVANATGAGLLIGLVGGVLATLAALVIGTLKAVEPLMRRMRR